MMCRGACVLTSFGVREGGREGEREGKGQNRIGLCMIGVSEVDMGEQNTKCGKARGMGDTGRIFSHLSSSLSLFFSLFLYVTTTNHETTTNHSGKKQEVAWLGRAWLSSLFLSLSLSFPIYFDIDLEGSRERMLDVLVV